LRCGASILVSVFSEWFTWSLTVRIDPDLLAVLSFYSFNL
jgi:hypothetical protein